MTDNPLRELPTREISSKRIYAYQFKLEELRGRIKVGETDRSVLTRVKEQVNTAGLSDVVEVLMDEPAVTRGGRVFRDIEVHEILKKDPSVRHLSGGGVEWFECTIEQVKSAYNAVFDGRSFDRIRDKSFAMRDEQVRAVAAADEYFSGARSADRPPRFLWNAKMRFGKTFAAYHLAKSRNAKRVLIITYKPAVEASWQSDLETHVDFDGWFFFSRQSTEDPSAIGPDVPVVCFASLQDLRGRTDDGAIKEHNKWIHGILWDLVIVDEYHYGAWNDATRQLLAGEERRGFADYEAEVGDDDDPEGSRDVTDLVGVRGRAFLCLSGTPFRALASQEFGTDQIFNWTYTDEQAQKTAFTSSQPNAWNPYSALPQMNLLVYQLPESLRQVATGGPRKEFDLNEFFAASGRGAGADFKHKDQVQAWLDWLRGQDVTAVVATLEAGTAKPFPYADSNVLPYMNHTVWFLPSVASVHAMGNLLGESHNRSFWGGYTVLPIAGDAAGVGVVALRPVRDAIGSGYDTKTITLTCGKLLTGVTVPQWSSILMLNNVEAPETYFQAAFRVQSPWSVRNPEGTDPNAERILKPACLTIDFAPTRGLRLFVDYGMRLGEGIDADSDVRQLARFLPVLGFDETRMRAVDVDDLIDVAFETTSVDARKMNSKKFIFPSSAKFDALDHDVRLALERVSKPRALQALTEGEETTINATPELRDVSDREEAGRLDVVQAEGEGELTGSDLEQRLTFLATRINAFMYLSEDVEKNLHDVLTTEEDDLFRAIMELGKQDMSALVAGGLFNEQAMRLAIHQFRRADVASFSYTGLDARTAAVCDSRVAPTGDAESVDAD